MYALPLTITLLMVIALAHCGTLRQYGRDWLIPKPEPQVDSKRITAKSVFIAPSFSAENVRCASGFSQDASGRCVKLVHVNQAAQLDFLLQRLNAMYGAPVVNHFEKQPLQVTVGIPVEPVNSSMLMEDAGIYSHVTPPEGEVSIDLLTNITANTTKDSNDANFVPQVLGGQSVWSESEDNETDVIIMPSKEIFQVDEEPIVTFTDIDTDDEDSTPKAPLDSDKSSNFEDLFSDEEVPDMSVTVDSEDAGLMAAVSKNVSNVIKKETFPEDDSVQTMTESEANTESGAAFLKNETQSDLSSGDKTAQSVIFVDKNKQISTTSTLADDAMKEVSTGGGIMYNKIEIEDDMGNAVHTVSSGKMNGTSFKPSDVPSAQASTSMLTSTEESTDSTIETWTGKETTVSSPAAHEDTTLESKVPAATAGLPTLLTQEGYAEPTEQTISANNDSMEGDVYHVGDVDQEYFDSDFEYPIRDVDLEVGYDDLAPQSENDGTHASADDSKSTEASAIASQVHRGNDSVEVNSSEGILDSASGDGGVSEHEYTVDTEDVRVNLNQSVYLNSTNIVDKTQSDNSYKAPSSNGTNFGEILSFSEATSTGVETPSETLSHADGVNMSNFQSSNVEKLGGEVLKVESSVQNVNTDSHSVAEKVQSGSEETQQVITSHHSVHVIYPQSIIQVVNVKQDHHGHTADTANTNEPETELKETTDSNSASSQFHNLSPNPLPHHNSHPVSQVPLEKLPGSPPKYNGYPYPPQHQPHRPNIHPHPYQQVHPHPQHHPQRPQLDGGFVRFPTDVAPDFHRSHPHAHGHGEGGNAVRFPQEDPRTNDKYSRWGNNWTLDEGRGVVPERRYWAGDHNRRNYWAHNRPARRRPQPSYY